MTKEGMNYCYGSWNINVPTLIKHSVTIGVESTIRSRIHLFDDSRQAIQRYLEKVFNNRDN